MKTQRDLENVAMSGGFVGGNLDMTLNDFLNTSILPSANYRDPAKASTFLGIRSKRIKGKRELTKNLNARIRRFGKIAKQTVSNLTSDEKKYFKSQMSKKKNMSTSDIEIMLKNITGGKDYSRLIAQRSQEEGGGSYFTTSLSDHKKMLLGVLANEYLKDPELMMTVTDALKTDRTKKMIRMLPGVQRQRRMRSEKIKLVANGSKDVAFFADPRYDGVAPYLIYGAGTSVEIKVRNKTLQIKLERTKQFLPDIYRSKLPKGYKLLARFSTDTNVPDGVYDFSTLTRRVLYMSKKPALIDVSNDLFTLGSLSGPSSGSGALNLGSGSLNLGSGAATDSGSPVQQPLQMGFGSRSRSTSAQQPLQMGFGSRSRSISAQQPLQMGFGNAKSRSPETKQQVLIWKDLDNDDFVLTLNDRILYENGYEEDDMSKDGSKFGVTISQGRGYGGEIKMMTKKAIEALLDKHKNQKR